jgi:hypothetical protein
LARRLPVQDFFGSCPREFPATDCMYRIKSDLEGFERTVNLSPSIGPETSYDEVKPLRRAGRH